MLIIILSLFLGVLATYSTDLKFLPIKPVWYKFTHNWLGLLGYIIGMISLCYAYYTSWFAWYNGEESRLAALILTVAVTVWSISGAVVSLFNQLNSIISWLLFSFVSFCFLCVRDKGGVLQCA